MTKTVSAGFLTRLADTSTAFTRLWRMVWKDGQEFFFTTTNRDIVFAGDTYSAIGGFVNDAIDTTSDYTIGNTDIHAFFTSGLVSEADIRAGKAEDAEIFITVVDSEDPAIAELKLIRGEIGNIRMNHRDMYTAEFRSMKARLSEVELNELYGVLCRADLGDERCKIPIQPTEIVASTAYLSAADNPSKIQYTEFVRIRDLNELVLTVTNPGAESGTTGWTNETGTLTTDTTPTPHGGSNIFKGTDADATTKARQDIAVPGAQEAAVDAGQRLVRLRWWQQATATSDDTAEMTVRFLDGAMAPIGGETSAGLTAEDIGSWKLREMNVAIPTLTRHIRIAMNMVRDTGGTMDGFIDDIDLSMYDDTTAFTLVPDWGDRIFECTTSGTTGTDQPIFDPVLGNTTTWGGAVFTAREAWQRAVVVDSLDGTEPNRVIKVTELTPNSGGVTIGRDYFPDDAMNGGAIIWLTGNNAGTAMEIKDFTADDGVTIVQDVTLFLSMPLAVQVGDTALVYRGCNKTMPICSGIFNNATNKRSEDYIPGVDFLFTYPDARTE